MLLDFTPAGCILIRISATLSDMSNGCSLSPNVVMELSSLLLLLFEDDVDYFDNIGVA
jgi:hypothetical protein